MRIARINTMLQPIPAVGYGGTQRSMAQMTAFQAAICAHDITLYGPADSTIIQFTQQIAQKLSLFSEINKKGNTIAITTSKGQKGFVRLRTTGHKAIGYGHTDEEKRNLELLQLMKDDDKVDPFDIIHVHLKRIEPKYLIEAGLGHKMLTHIHGKRLFKDYKKHRYPLICISHSQAESLQKKYDANIFAIIHHGLDKFTHHLTTKQAGYLSWVGRFIAEKGADTAIKIAKAANKPLLLAGTFDNSKQLDYFQNVIKPFIDVIDTEFLDRIANSPPETIAQEIRYIGSCIGTKSPVIYTGPVNEAQKQTLYGNALATLFPIKWREPFGRIMIESMACGTPVIGTVQIGEIYCGSVEEVIEHGVTGVHIKSIDQDEVVLQSANAIRHIQEINRANVRKIFERDWTSERLAIEIDQAYNKFLEQGSENYQHTGYYPCYK